MAWPRLGLCRGPVLHAGAAHDIELLLAGPVFPRHGLQGVVVAPGLLRVDVHHRAFPVHPFPAVQRPLPELLDHHGRRESAVLQAHVKFLAAFEAQAHIVGGTAEDDDHIPAQLRRPPEGVAEQLPAVALALAPGLNGHRAEGEDVLNRPVPAGEGGFGVHHAADDLPVQLGHEIKLRDEVPVIPHDADQVMLGAAGGVDVVKGPPGNVLHRLAVRLGLISDVKHKIPLSIGKRAA